ncbi:hypothetical protein YC2023_076342 [Brassica napus]
MNPGTKNKQSSSSVRRTDPIRLGRWPSWIKHATSSAIHQAGPVKFGGWPSLIKRATSSAIGHGFYPLLTMVYKEDLEESGYFGVFWSLLMCRAAQTRQMFNYGWIPYHHYLDPIFCHEIYL